VPAQRVNGSRHAADDGPDGAAGGRHGVAGPSGGGRRRAPEPDPEATGGGRRRAPEPGTEATGGGRRRAPEGVGAAVGPEPYGPRPDKVAVGLPGWLAPSGQVRPDPLTATAVTPAGWPPGAPPGPVGATRAADPDARRKALVAVVRLEWLVGVACFVGLAYGRTAPYTAGLLAGVIVVAAAYGRVRWQAATTRRPPDRDRVPTYAVVAAVVVAVVVVPAAMVGALTLARLAVVAAVTCATFAAVLIGRTGG
jgi:hypothetical protein